MSVLKIFFIATVLIFFSCHSPRSEQSCLIDGIAEKINSGHERGRVVPVISGADGESFVMLRGTRDNPLSVTLHVELSSAIIERGYYFDDKRLVLIAENHYVRKFSSEGVETALTEPEGEKRVYYYKGHDINKGDAVFSDDDEIRLAAWIVRHWEDDQIDIESMVKCGKDK